MHALLSIVPASVLQSAKTPGTTGSHTLPPPLEPAEVPLPEVVAVEVAVVEPPVLAAVVPAVDPPVEPAVVPVPELPPESPVLPPAVVIDVWPDEKPVDVESPSPVQATTRTSAQERK
jgi:hypothetical protein